MHHYEGMIYTMKTRTSITIDGNILQKAKENGINISETSEIALEREIISETSKAYQKGLENQIDAHMRFLKHKNLLGEWEQWKYG